MLKSRPSGVYHPGVKIKLNFSDEIFDGESLSVAEIMKRKNFSFPHVITRLNGKLVDRDMRPGTMVRDGDDLEVYHLISGG